MNTNFRMQPFLEGKVTNMTYPSMFCLLPLYSGGAGVRPSSLVRQKYTLVQSTTGHTHTHGLLRHSHLKTVWSLYALEIVLYFFFSSLTRTVIAKQYKSFV